MLIGQDTLLPKYVFFSEEQSTDDVDCSFWGAKTSISEEKTTEIDLEVCKLLIKFRCTATVEGLKSEQKAAARSN